MPMMTFSLSPTSGSEEHSSAASVSTRVVSWKEAADSHEFQMWHARHAGAFPVFFLLGCVRPDLMVSLMRCRAFGWDLFDAPLKMGARSFLASSALVSTALSDIPQLVAMWPLASAPPPRGSMGGIVDDDSSLVSVLLPPASAATKTVGSYDALSKLFVVTFNKRTADYTTHSCLMPQPMTQAHHHV